MSDRRGKKPRLILVRIVVFCGIVAVGPAVGFSQQVPDIRSVAADLRIPPLVSSRPEAGSRVRRIDPDASELYYTLYLPTNFDVRKQHPMIVEYSGNGGYRSPFGDRSDGIPEGSKLGFGVSGGQDFVWVCLPFVTGDGKSIAKQWWGSPPHFSPMQTVDYAERVLDLVVHEFNVDDEAILLCGFSRGAIACNLIGLHDDSIARRWCGFVAYSHYDGSRDWGLPGTDRVSAEVRLGRLMNRPQFICHESQPKSERDDQAGIERTRSFLDSLGVEGDFTFAETGFRNHSDAWILRPSGCRQQLRSWVRQIPSVARSLRHLHD